MPDARNKLGKTKTLTRPRLFQVHHFDHITNGKTIQLRNKKENIYLY